MRIKVLEDSAFHGTRSIALKILFVCPALGALAGGSCELSTEVLDPGVSSRIIWHR